MNKSVCIIKQEKDKANKKEIETEHKKQKQKRLEIKTTKQGLNTNTTTYNLNLLFGPNIKQLTPDNNILLPSTILNLLLLLRFISFFASCIPLRSKIVAIDFFLIKALAFDTTSLIDS